MNRRSRTHRLLLFVLAVPVFSTPVRGEDRSSMTIKGESRAIAKRFAEVSTELAGRNNSQAIERLQAILANSGNELVPVSASRSVSASRLCQVRLAGLSAEGLRLYRQRYENQAVKKLQTAMAERDQAALRRLVEDAFCTRAAEKAIDRLGDLAFERGRFDEAEEWWRLLTPLPDSTRDPATRGSALVYPDPSLNPARLQAKQLLARLFSDPNSQGRTGKAEPHDGDWLAAVEDYRRRHAKAEGTVCGRKGNYTETLLALAEERQKTAVSDRDDWTTFGGDPSRGKLVPAPEDILDRLSALCREGPTWTFDLQRRTRQEQAEFAPAVNAAQARTLAFHPVVVGHRILVADARRVTAYDARSGQSEQWYDAARLNGGVHPNVELPAPADLRYTLTAANDRLYARLGAQDIGSETPTPKRLGFEPKPARDNETLLACFGISPDDKTEHFRWSERGIVHANAFFEGAPLVSGGRVWISSTRYQENRCIHAIQCYADGDASKPPLWQHDLCESGEVKLGDSRFRHELLTLAGTQLVYCTHDGAIIALDAATGRTNWAVRYPHRTLVREEQELKDLAPVLYAAGRLYVAPADSDSLLCLDPATGCTLWELEPLRAVHLLGVGQGRLIFTTPGGIRGVRADTGAPSWTVPEIGGVSLLDGLTPSGRGLLIGDLVLFPTVRPRHDSGPNLETMVYVLRQRDGRPADSPAALHRLPSGNLAYANGILVVADRRTLSVYAPPRLLLGERRAAVRRVPNSSLALLDLAKAEGDAGQDHAALRTLRRLRAMLLRDEMTTKRKQLLVESHIIEQQILLGSAGRAAEDERWNEAAEFLDRAASLPLSSRYRLYALLSAARIWRRAKQTDREITVWDSIRKNERMNAIPVMDRQGCPLFIRPFDRRSRANLGREPKASSDDTPSKNSKTQLFHRAWHVSLARDEAILEGETEELLTGRADGRLCARSAATGGPQWTTRLPFVPRWAGSCGAEMVVAGDSGIVSLRRDSGEIVWHFPAPEYSLYPCAGIAGERVVLAPRPLEPLSDFHLKRGRLFFLQGRRRLFAIRVEAGALLWVRWAPDALLELPPPRGLFSVHFHAGEDTILVQCSRRRWLLDASTGRRMHETVDDRELWRQPPLALDERSLCIIADNKNLELIDAKTGRRQWFRRPTGGTVFSGETPSVLGNGNVLFFVQPLNVGYSLIRLDPASGKPLWSRPLLLDAKELQPNAWSLDAEALYTIEEGQLTARSTADGKVVWQRPLRGFVRWQTHRVGSSLVVSPSGAIEWQWSSLLGREAMCPVAFYDPKTGQLIQRCHFRLETPLPPRILASLSRKGSGCNSFVRFDSPQPFVAVGGDLWGLTSIEEHN